MPSNRHRSPFPGTSAWPAHSNHISSLYNLLLLLAHNNPMYVFRCYGVEPVCVLDFLAVLGLFISPNTQYPVLTQCTYHHQSISRRLVPKLFCISNFINIIANMITIAIIRNERLQDSKAEHFFSSYSRSPICITAEMERVFHNDCCHHQKIAKHVFTVRE